MCFPGGSEVKNLPASAGDTGSIPGLGRSSGEGNGTPLQYSRLGNPMDRGAWWATVHGVTKELNTTYWLKQTKQCTKFFIYQGIFCELIHNSEPLTYRSISPFLAFIGTKLAMQLAFKEEDKTWESPVRKEKPKEGMTLCWGVLSEGSWRSKAWEARSGDGVSGTAMGRPRAQHICLLWGLQEEVTSETHPNWKRTKMVPACPHKNYETARGFGQDICKILHSCSYLTDKQKPFKNITPQSCEFNWDSPKSFPHPLSSLATICSVAVWSCLVPVPGFFLKCPVPEKCCLVFSGLHQALKTVWSSNSFSETTSFTNHSWNNYKKEIKFLGSHTDTKA